MHSRNHDPMRIGPTSDSDVTRGKSLGWSIAGSVALLVVAFFLGQTGMLIAGFACWDDLGPPGCNIAGLVVGWVLIAFAASVAMAAVVLLVRAVIRFRRASDGPAADTSKANGDSAHL